MAQVPSPALPKGTSPGGAGSEGRYAAREPQKMSFPGEGGTPWFVFRKKAETPLPSSSLKGMGQTLGRGSGARQAHLGCDVPAELHSICAFFPTAEGNWLPAAEAKGLSNPSLTSSLSRNSEGFPS